MRNIIIPLLIIALIVGVYYARDAWDGVKSSIPFLEDSAKPDSSPRGNSPLDVLR